MNHVWDWGEDDTVYQTHEKSSYYERINDMENKAVYIGLEMAEERINHAKAMQQAMAKQVGGSHYKEMVIQPIEFIERNKLSFSAGNVVKYVCRADKKNGLEDLEKAKHYIELMIELRQ